MGSRTIICALILFLMFSSFATLADQWRDYKCYVSDTDGRMWVHIFELDARQRNAGEAAVNGKFIFDSFGRPLAQVREVRECVPLDKVFVSLDARRLEDATPM